MMESLGSSCVTLNRLVGHDERQFCLSSHRAVAVLGTLLSSGNVMVREVSATVKLTAYWGCTRVARHSLLSALRRKGCVSSRGSSPRLSSSLEERVSKLNPEG